MDTSLQTPKLIFSTEREVVKRISVKSAYYKASIVFIVSNIMVMPKVNFNKHKIVFYMSETTIKKALQK